MPEAGTICWLNASNEPYKEEDALYLALKYKPDNALGLTELGGLLSERGDEVGSKGGFRKGYGGDPSFAAWYRLAMVRRELRDLPGDGRGAEGGSPSSSAVLAYLGEHLSAWDVRRKHSGIAGSGRLDRRTGRSSGPLYVLRDARRARQGPWLRGTRWRQTAPIVEQYDTRSAKLKRYPEAAKAF
jgi:hypothetical protein